MRDPASDPPLTSLRGAVVELAGLPGCGKTTLSGELNRLLLAEQVRSSVGDLGLSAAAPRVSRAARRSAYAAREGLRHPRSSLRAARLLATSRQPRASDPLRMLLQWLATQHLEVTARGSGGLRLLEEGAVQTIWTAALRAGRLRPAELWGCVPSGCLPDAVLLVELSPELAAERLDARGSRHSRTQLLPRAERIGELRRGGELLDDVVAHCPAPVLRIPADGLSPGELAAAARSVVLTLARR